MMHEDERHDHRNGYSDMIICQHQSAQPAQFWKSLLITCRTARHAASCYTLASTTKGVF